MAAHLQWLATRHLAETRPCPTCRADTGDTCRRTNGMRLTEYPAHHARIPTAHEPHQEDQ